LRSKFQVISKFIMLPDPHGASKSL
jgi:hypothetical protein